MKSIILSANSSWYLYNFRASTISTLLSKDFTVICIAPKDKYSKKLIELGALWEDINIDPSGKNPFKDLIFLRSLHKRFSYHMPVAVFNFTIKNNIYGAIAARLLRLDAYSNITGLGTAFLNSPILSIIAKTLYKFSQSKCIKVFCQNEEDLFFLEKNKLVPKEKLILLPGSGVDTDRFHPRASRQDKSPPLKLLFAGRIIKDKGLIELINSVKIINYDRINCELWLVGFADVNNSSAIPIHEINSWNNLPGIKYFGSSDNIEDFLSQIDVAILPSYREGMPKFLLEAGAMEIPSITTDVPGCRNIIKHNFNGLVCNPRDELSLTNAISTMINMPHAKRLELGINARSLVKRKFDEKIVISKTLEPLFQSMTNK